MVASLPQEQRFKQDFDRTRLAAIRGDRFSVPLGANNSNFFEDNSENNGEPANNDRFFSQGSEDGILAQYPLASPLSGGMDTAAIDPNNFAHLQQQARMKEGIGAPSLLPDEIANLPDPEFSTEEDPVTYDESLRSLEGQARNAEDIESVQAFSNAIRKKMNDATQQYTEELKRLAKEKISRWTAKIAGNGSNAVDSFGFDAWITFCLTYIYLMARGAVSVLFPETQAPQNLGSFKDALQYNAKQALHILIPPYRPLREPGDFLYFLLLFIISILIACLVIAIFITIASIIYSLQPLQVQILNSIFTLLPL